MHIYELFFIFLLSFFGNNYIALGQLISKPTSSKLVFKPNSIIKVTSIQDLKGD